TTCQVRSSIPTGGRSSTGKPGALRGGVEAERASRTLDLHTGHLLRRGVEKQGGPSTLRLHTDRRLRRGVEKQGGPSTLRLHTDRRRSIRTAEHSEAVRLDPRSRAYGLSNGPSSS